MNEEDILNYLDSELSDEFLDGAQEEGDLEESSFRFSMKSVDNPELLCHYDSDSGNYRYTFPNGTEFYISVPLGGWSTEPVELNLPESVTATYTYQDDNLLSGDITRFSGKGNYSVMLEENLYGNNGNESYSVAAVFHIDPEDVKSWSLLTAPMGMTIHHASFNGEKIQAKGKYLSLRADGNYIVVFQDTQGIPCYQLTFTRDTVAPAIYFSKDISKTIMESVDFILSDDNAALSLFRNGEEVTASQARIVVPGDYEATISDVAGNERTYYFRVAAPSRAAQYQLVIALLTALLLACSGFLYWRGRLRVR